MSVRRPLLIDCDPGIDDALAVLLALASPEVQVVGLNTSFGNATLEHTTHNARGLLELAGAKDVPVAPGAAKSLAGAAAQCVAHIHGRDGMADCGCLPGSLRAVETGIKAALQLIEMSHRYCKELVVLSLGPLTNIALAVALDPGIVNRVGHLVIMGGNVTVAGNATPAAEANVLADPLAADRVLGEPWRRCSMVGLDVTQRVVLGSTEIDRLLSTKGVAGRLSRPLRHYEAFYKRTNGINGICMHDPTAMALLLWPELFETRDWPLRVQTGGLGVGKTWAHAGDTDDDSPPDWVGRPLVQVCVGVAETGLVAEFLTRLEAQPRQ